MPDNEMGKFTRSPFSRIEVAHGTNVLKATMCLKGRSRFCLICLLIYSFLPSTILQTVDEPTTFLASSTPSPKLALTSHDHLHDHDHDHADHDHDHDHPTDIDAHDHDHPTDIDAHDHDHPTDIDAHDHEHHDHHHDHDHPTDVDAHDHDHHDHHHDMQVTEVQVSEKDYFIDALMTKYGNGDNMTFEGFEHLLENLGLGGTLRFGHSVNCHKNGKDTFKKMHKDHAHSDPSEDNLCNETEDTSHDSHDHSEHVHEANPESDNSFEHVHDHDGDDHSHNHNHDEESDTATSQTKREVQELNKNECIPARLMLSLVGSLDTDILTKEMFKELCPSLIYQIDADTCHSHHASENQPHDHDHDSHTEAISSFDIGSISAKVWGFSAIAVLIISLVGLLGVAVIPIMRKVFYNHLLQFLVALAVGALSGDALLHLLPHAMSGGHGHGKPGDSHETEGEHEHSHDLGPIMKGLCGLLGIYFFFITERLLTIFTEKKRRKKTLKNRDKFMTNEEMVKIGNKLAGKENECDEMIMTIHPNKDGEQEIVICSESALQAYADETHKEHCFENSSALLHEHRPHQQVTSFDEENDSMLKLESAKPHGHGHSHAVDGVPNSVASVAWMVILGDGIHNFSDGLAIGAAFANSITGGFSTSIAVFCHELPHEIGDFAMLLRAGMAPKQALLYNCLSSILCFIGMLIGVAIGNVQDASLWIFAVVGGMFLYIALVDMLPEMSAVETKEGENSHFHLFIQVIGMSIGAGIMLIIALYEDKLRTLLE